LYLRGRRDRDIWVVFRILFWNTWPGVALPSPESKRNDKRMIKGCEVEEEER
jgi:hypothetical protein